MRNANRELAPMKRLLSLPCGLELWIGLEVSGCQIESCGKICTVCVLYRPRNFDDGMDAASAAFEVGYESASQFNREYSRFFGQPPMRDIKARLLAGAATARE